MGWKLVIVVRCPPCWLAVPANTLPTLPTGAPDSQSLVVRSRKFRIWAQMWPKRSAVRAMPGVASCSKESNARLFFNSLCDRPSDMAHPPPAI